jgi:hypothetical protein
MRCLLIYFLWLYSDSMFFIHKNTNMSLHLTRPKVKVVNTVKVLFCNLNKWLGSHTYLLLFILLYGVRLAVMIVLAASDLYRRLTVLQMCGSPHSLDLIAAAENGFFILEVLNVVLLLLVESLLLFSEPHNCL